MLSRAALRPYRSVADQSRPRAAGTCGCAKAALTAIDRPGVLAALLMALPETPRRPAVEALVELADDLELISLRSRVEPFASNDRPIFDEAPHPLRIRPPPTASW